MATTWPGSCTVFMIWPWPWIYIRAWQDHETGLKRTLTFKKSEIISTWHFQNSKNNSTFSNPSSISKIPKLTSLGKSKIYFITSWLGLHVELGGADPQGRVLRPFHQNNFYSSEQLRRQSLQEFQWNINLSIFLRYPWIFLKMLSRFGLCKKGRMAGKEKQIGRPRKIFCQHWYWGGRQGNTVLENMNSI